MTPLQFLKAVWPEQGLYCLAFPRDPGPGFDHLVFNTIEEAAARAEKLKGEKNVYFSTHSLILPKVWNKKKWKSPETKEWVPGWSVRLQTNMAFGRDFFFDIDVGSTGNKYRSQAEAVQALRDFCRKTRLPKPLVVNSGNGVHVHWIVSEDLKSNSEWYTQAARLRQLATYYKFKVDPMRTVDTSSVLRVPGTFNLKKGLKLPVQGLTDPEIVTPSQWAAAITRALDDVEIVPEEARASGATEVDDIFAELGSNIASTSFDNLSKPAISAIYAVCPQLKRISEVKGGNYREPVWYNFMGVLQHAEDGRAECHRLSRKNPAYEKDYVDAKIDQWKTGPTSCAKLMSIVEEEHQEICKGCPHLGTSGPWSIARRLETAPAPMVRETVEGVEVVRELPQPPPPYKRAKNGAIEMLMETKEGKAFTDVIYPYDFYPLDRVRDEVGETETQIWRVHLPHGIVRTFAITAAIFVDEKQLRIRLANNGIYPANFDKLKVYMSYYIMELQKRSAQSVQYTHLGWDQDFQSFALPQGLISRDGSITPIQFTKIGESIKPFMGKRGTLENQIKLMDFFLDKRYVQNQFVIAAALASPLFAVTGFAGTIVNACGISGASKSTALYTGGSFWGRPTRYVLDGQAQGNTLTFLATRGQILTNLPMMMDEITQMDPEVAKEFALGASQPGDRGRCNPDGSLKDGVGSERSSLIITSSNKPLHALLSQNNSAGNAASVRVFEVPFERLGLHYGYDVDAYLRDLMENYGHIGEKFMRFALKNVDRMKQRIYEVKKALELEANMSPEERFWFAVSATVLVTVEMGNRIGIWKFDVEVMREWLLTVMIPTLRGVVNAEMQGSEPLTLLTDYLHYVVPDVIRTDDAGEPTYVPVGKLMGHYRADKAEMVLLKDGFRDFCQRRKQFVNHALRALLKDGVVSSTFARRTLGAGTTVASGQSTCFIVDMSHEKIASDKKVQEVMPSNIVTFKKRKIVAQ